MSLNNRPSLVTTIIIRNEADRYLQQNLTLLSKISTEILVVDDCSTDNSIEICRQFQNVKLVKLDRPSFLGDESVIRHKTYHTARTLNPDWILSLDADEIFDEEIIEKIPDLLNHPTIEAWGFRIYDLWSNEKSYREDQLWERHHRYTTRLVKNKSLNFDWNNIPVHAPHFTDTLLQQLKHGYCNTKIFHYGFLYPERTKIILDSWHKHDSKNNFISAEYKESLLDKSPKIKTLNQTKITRPRILIGSPVCHPNRILQEFFNALFQLDTDGLEVDYCFIDDNSDTESSKLLSNLATEHTNFTVIDKNECTCLGKNSDDYENNNLTVKWPVTKTLKVSEMRNYLMKKAASENYDFLFMLDTDLILQKETLKQLIGCEKDIISEVFWTQWYDSQPASPQVWAQDNYSFYWRDPTEKLDSHQITEEADALKNKFRSPGITKVGGLGACTLFSRQILEIPNAYSPLYNISLKGEDRHFCVKMVALGYTLYSDGTYPPYHLYTDNLIDTQGYHQYIQEHRIVPTQSNPQILQEAL